MGPLLYCVVTQQTLYCLAVLIHGEWSNQKLLDHMHESFPELTAVVSIKGDVGLSRNYTDDEIAKLRSAGINVLTQRPDGTIMMGPGGGMTASNQAGKKSFKVSRAVDEVIDTLDALETAVRSKLSEKGIADADFKLFESDGNLFASDPARINVIKLGSDIVRPL